MSKLDLNTVAGGYQSQTALNNNFEKIELWSDTLLSRTGASPNSMLAVLDMNSNRIINLGTPINSTDAATKGLVEANNADTIIATTDTLITPDGADRTYTLGEIGALALGAGVVPDNVIYLARDEDFMTAWNAGLDVTPSIQAIINATTQYPATTALTFVFPTGYFVMSDVFTGKRYINFKGVDYEKTNIVPADTLTYGVFNIEFANSSVQDLSIDDTKNSWDIPTFTPDPNQLISMIRIGRGGSTDPRNTLIQNVSIANSRGRGIRWEGGSVSIFNNIFIGSCAAGGFEVPPSNGDTNHWKIHNMTVSNCFNFGIDLGGTGSTNSAGAGWLAATKSYGNQNFNIRINGYANRGSVFVEGSNGPSEGNPNLTRTAGSNVLTGVIKNMQTLRVGSVVNNGTAGFANGTYVTAIDYVNRTVTMSTNATSSGTSTITMFTHQGDRVPSIWFTSRSNGNDILIGGDSLDPDCFLDESSNGKNHIVLHDRNGNYIEASPYLKVTDVLSPMERYSGNPNNSQRFAAFATMTAGSPDIQLVDNSQFMQVQKTPYATPTVACNGGWVGNLSISSINQSTKVITLSGNATATGTFLVSFGPSFRGGWRRQMFADLQILDGAAGANIEQTIFTVGRGGAAVGNVTAGSPTITLFKKQDFGSTENPSANFALYCEDNRVVPDGTLIASGGVVDNGDGTYTITMTNNALVDGTGVRFYYYNNYNIRRVWPKTRQAANNPSAVAANYRLGEIYSTVTGNMQMVVPTATDGRYEIVADIAPVAAGAYAVMYDTATVPDTADSNGKAFTNIVIGDYVEVSTSNYQAGLRFFAEITGTNSFRIICHNWSGGSIDPSNKRFYLKFTKR